MSFDFYIDSFIVLLIHLFGGVLSYYVNYIAFLVFLYSKHILIEVFGVSEVQKV